MVKSRLLPCRTHRKFIKSYVGLGVIGVAVGMAEWIDLVAMIRDLQVHVQETGDRILAWDHFERVENPTNPFLPGYPVMGFIACKKSYPKGETDFNGDWMIALHNAKRSLDSLDDEGKELLDQIRSRFTNGVNTRNLCEFLNDTPLSDSLMGDALRSLGSTE